MEACLFFTDSKYKESPRPFYVWRMPWKHWRECHSEPELENLLADQKKGFLISEIEDLLPTGIIVKLASEQGTSTQVVENEPNSSIKLHKTDGITTDPTRVKLSISSSITGMFKQKRDTIKAFVKDRVRAFKTLNIDLESSDTTQNLELNDEDSKNPTKKVIEFDYPEDFFLKRDKVSFRVAGMRGARQKNRPRNVILASFIRTSFWFLFFGLILYVVFRLLF